MFRHISRHILLSVCFVMALSWPIYAQSKLSTEEWQSDLSYLATRLPVVHPNLFHRVSRTEFDAAVERLRRRIPELEPHQILVEFARFTALIGEVHTGIMVHRQPRGGILTNANLRRQEQRP